MTEPAKPHRIARPIAAGCAIIGSMLVLATIISAALWLIPNARVSTMPPAPVTPKPPPPSALLVHVKPSVPEVATLLGEALGAQALMVTSLLPYEGTLTVKPNEAGTAAAAELRLSVPRSASALHVLLRAQIDQPTPSGYVVRDVQRGDDNVLTVTLEGPLGPPAELPSVNTPVLEPLPVTAEAVALVTVHNENGAWTRIATGYLQGLPDFEALPAEQNLTKLVSANVRVTFAGVDALFLELQVTCTTPEAALGLKADLESVLAEVHAQDALGLTYTHTLDAQQSTVKGSLRITGIRNAAQTIAKAYQAPETETEPIP